MDGWINEWMNMNGWMDKPAQQARDCVPVVLDHHYQIDPVVDQGPVYLKINVFIDSFTPAHPNLEFWVSHLDISLNILLY